ncbi:hypothetical protein LCGC14_1855130 [marine sediment metagenome]|uniref:Uncharacterized protein n=1 Tax=marine sediment metagenome TaxID=412755 RepID=A0A0F9G949_9ZZZZ
MGMNPFRSSVNKGEVKSMIQDALRVQETTVYNRVWGKINKDIKNLCEKALESVIFLPDTETDYNDYPWYGPKRRETVIKKLKSMVTATVEREFLTNYKAAVNTEEYIDNLIARINKKQLEV